MGFVRRGRAGDPGDSGGPAASKVRPVGVMAGKVPQVMQMEALECGAACLTMIAAYYGKWVPLEQVRKDCGVSRDGSSALNVVKAARGYGLDARGYRYEPEQLRERATFPCIVHWNFNHFVVCRGFKGDKVYLNDPARGECVVDAETFDRSFTGICLCMQPGPGLRARRRAGLHQAVRHGAPARLAAGACVRGTHGGHHLGAGHREPRAVAGVHRPAAHGQEPLLVWRLYRHLGRGGRDPDRHLGAQRHLPAARRGQDVGGLNATFFWKVLHLPMEFFSQRMAGDISSRASSNSQVASSMVGQLAPLVVNFAMLVVYLVIMVSYSPLLASIGLVATSLNIVVARVISAKRVNITRVQMRDQANLSGATMAGIDMIETLKASGAEAGFFQRWAGYQASANAQSVKYARLNQFLGLVPQMVTSAAQHRRFWWWACGSSCRAHFTIGAVLAFQGYLGQFVAPAQSLISTMQSFQEMRTDMERIQDVLDYEDDPLCQAPTLAEGAPCNKLRGGVRMEHVTFGYSRLARPLDQRLLHRRQAGR